MDLKRSSEIFEKSKKNTLIDIQTSLLIVAGAGGGDGGMKTNGDH